MFVLQILAALCIGTVLEARIWYGSYMPMRTYSSWQPSTPWTGYSYTPGTYYRGSMNYHPRDYRYQYTGGQMAPTMGPSMETMMPGRMDPYDSRYNDDGFMNGGRARDDISMTRGMPQYPQMMPQYPQMMPPSPKQMVPSAPTMRGNRMSSSSTNDVIDDLSRDLLATSSSSSGMITPASAPTGSMKRDSMTKTSLVSSLPSGSLSTETGLSGSTSSGVGVSSGGNVGMVSDASMGPAATRGMDMRGYYTGMGPSRMDRRGYPMGMGPSAYRYTSGFPRMGDDDGDDFMNGYYSQGHMYGNGRYTGGNPRMDYDDDNYDRNGGYDMYRSNMEYRPHPGYNRYMGYRQNTGYPYMGMNRGYNGMMTPPYTGYNYWVRGQPSYMNGGYMYANSVPMTNGIYGL